MVHFQQQVYLFPIGSHNFSDWYTLRCPAPTGFYTCYVRISVPLWFTAVFWFLLTSGSLDWSVVLYHWFTCHGWVLNIPGTLGENGFLLSKGSLQQHWWTSRYWFTRFHWVLETSGSLPSFWVYWLHRFTEVKWDSPLLWFTDRVKVFFHPLVHFLLFGILSTSGSLQNKKIQ